MKMRFWYTQLILPQEISRILKPGAFIEVLIRFEVINVAAKTAEMYMHRLSKKILFFLQVLKL
jgi:hypothetical protein